MVNASMYYGGNGRLDPHRRHMIVVYMWGEYFEDGYDIYMAKSKQ